MKRTPNNKFIKILVMYRCKNIVLIIFSSAKVSTGTQNFHQVLQMLQLGWELAKI